MQRGTKGKFDNLAIKKMEAINKILALESGRTDSRGQPKVEERIKTNKNR